MTFPELLIATFLFVFVMSVVIGAVVGYIQDGRKKDKDDDNV